MKSKSEFKRVKTMLDIEPPDYECKYESYKGYTWSKLYTMFKDYEEEKKFIDWMDGQTMGLHPVTNETIVYEDDVIRGLAMLRNKIPTYWD
jgi:hypothetical protein